MKVRGSNHKSITHFCNPSLACIVMVTYVVHTSHVHIVHTPIAQVLIVQVHSIVVNSQSAKQS